MGEDHRHRPETPGVAHAITIGGVSALDNKASLANSGIIYLMLEDWGVRGKSEDLRAIYTHLSAALEAFEQASTLLLVPPPITGLGLSGGFQMQVELTGGSFDYTELQRVADAIVEKAKKQPEIAHVLTPFRANVPQLSLVVDRTQAETLDVSVGEVFDTLQSYLGSSYVNQFVRFGHTFMVFAQADSQFRLQPRDLKRLYVRSQSGQMVPISAVVDIQPTLGPALITLYNLHPSATVNGRGARGYSSGQTIQVMEKIAASQLGPNMQFQWTAMSYQENLVGNSIYFTFALGMLLVYFVLAGQYESYLIPGAVILAVPLALLGTVAALSVTGLANNIYVQIGLVLLIALSAKNAILVVEMARARRARREQHPRCRRRSGAHSLSTHPDDFLHLHVGCLASGSGERRRCPRAQVPWDYGVQRYARVDLPGRAVRAFTVRRAAEVVGAAIPPIECGSACVPGRASVPLSYLISASSPIRDFSAGR